MMDNVKGKDVVSNTMEHTVGISETDSMECTEDGYKSPKRSLIESNDVTPPTKKRKLNDENDIVKLKILRQEFHKGEKLVVKTGAFKGKEATFLSKKSKERVRILLRFVNHLITAEIPASDVGEKEVIEALKL